MNEQLSFLDFIQESFVDQLQHVLDEMIIEQELPKKSLHLFSNRSHKGENAGEEISKSICIYEPEYPAIKEDVDNPGKNLVVMNVRQDENTVELLIRTAQFESIDTPTNVTIKKSKADPFVHTVFQKSDTNLIPYIKENILYCLKNYHTKEKSFGCCSSFIECSDAKRCVHKNKLYATACMYRRHLEEGHIFYGKNKNI